MVKLRFYLNRFPHSEIPGSQVATHLPEAYRCYAASFIATLCQGILPTPLIDTLCLNTPIYWKLKVKMSSRRDDEGVALRYAEEEQQRDRLILSFSKMSQDIFPFGFVLRRSRV